MTTEELKKFKEKFDKAMETLESEGFFDKLEKREHPERFDSQGKRITTGCEGNEKIH